MKELFEAWRSRNQIAIVDFGLDKGRVLHLKKSRKGIVCLAAEDFSYGPENFTFEDPHSQLIERVVTQFNLAHVPLVINLPGQFFRHHFVRLPNDYPGPASDWVEENISHFLPPGLSKNRISYGFQIMTNSGSSEGLFLTMGRKEMVGKWTAIFEALELRVLALCAGHYSILNTFAFLDSRYHLEDWVFLTLGDGTISIMVTHQGDLVEYSEFDKSLPDSGRRNGGSSDAPKEIDGEDLYNLVKSPVASANTGSSLHQIVVTGIKPNQAIQSKLSEFAPVIWGGEILKQLVPNSRSDEFVGLLGLGVCELYPHAERADPLPTPFQVTVIDKVEQVRTLNIAGIAAIVLISLWLMVASGGFFVNRKLRFWGEEMSKVQNRITRIEALKDAGRGLSEELASSQAIRNRQSYVAHTLWVLARTLPEGLWFRDLQYGNLEEQESAKTSQAALVVEGLAISEEGPTRLLSELEKLSDLRTVQIDVLEMISPETVYKQSKLRKIPLVKFKLSALFLKNP